MIDFEKTEPKKLGYDRPSTKFLSFLRKHYNLASYIPQNNNFVVFNQFFDNDKKNYTNSNFSMLGEQLICIII